VSAARRFLLDAIEGHARVEDALIEIDQPIHVGCQERHVVEIVEQSHLLAASNARCIRNDVVGDTCSRLKIHATCHAAIGLVGHPMD
jgi:hypothetical protein